MILSALVEDTLMLGDSLQFKIIDDKIQSSIVLIGNPPPLECHLILMLYKLSETKT